MNSRQAPPIKLQSRLVSILAGGGAIIGSAASPALRDSARADAWALHSDLLVAARDLWGSMKYFDDLNGESSHVEQGRLFEPDRESVGT